MTASLGSLPSVNRLPVGNLDEYFQAVNSVAMLSATQERELAERYRQEQDLNAAWHLVLAHLRFVVHVARGYSGYGLPQADLIQEGNVGLMKAVKRFDPAVGVRLVSFAVHWIRAEMHEFILRNWRIVKVATTKAQRKLFFNLRGAKKRLGWLNREEVATVANELGVSAETVLEMEQRLHAYDAAFDGDGGDEDGERVAPAGYLGDLRFEPGRQTEEADWHAHAQRRLASALAGLDARGQDIVNQRWLSDTKTTLHELANQYGVSAERIRQLESQALKKLRNALSA